NRTIFFSTHITTDLDKIADYIAYMQRGKLVFNQSTEELVENYAIVKGDTALLDPDTEKSFIRIKRTATGFTALTNKKQEVRQVFEDTVLIEKASLEEIMYFSKGGKQYV